MKKENERSNQLKLKQILDYVEDFDEWNYIPFFLHKNPMNTNISELLGLWCGLTESKNFNKQNSSEWGDMQGKLFSECS